MAAPFDVVQSAAELTREKHSPVSMATATGRMLSLKGDEGGGAGVAAELACAAPGTL